MSNIGNRSIALAANQQSSYAEVAKEDQLLIESLRELGIDTTEEIWDSPTVNWKQYDAVVIRSTWDYPQKLTPFLAWVDRIESLDVPLYNPAEVIKWNAEKSYLTQLQQRGVETIPTLWIPFISAQDLIAQVKEQKWPQFVVKPTVSVGAENTFLFSTDVSPLPELPYTGGTPLMVQPFLEQIKTDGEWSFVYFGGKLSHIVRKRPKPGDYRVQAHFGGIYTLETAPPLGIEAAEKVLSQVPFDLLYGRVDMVRTQDKFQLMELELIEPALYFTMCKEAPMKMARAIEKIL